MFSKPIASGAMLVVILGAVGVAAVQQGTDVEQVGITQVQTASPTRTPVASPSPAERAAGAPNRVVDTAGFPVVPERPAEEELTTGPVVTVNGRPLGASGTNATTAADDEAETPAPTPRTQDQAPRDSAPDVQVAVTEPPRPLPRPEGLSAAPRSDAIDYDAIAAAAGGQTSTGVLQPPAQQQSVITLPQQQQPVITTPLPQQSATVVPQQPAMMTPPAPVPGADGLLRDPNRDELVGVVGPSGQIIWVYEEQLRETERSRVTFQNNQPQPQQTNPFGFVYD